MKKPFNEDVFTQSYIQQDKEYKWKPFPDHYVCKKAQVDPSIPQISMKYPYVHVIAKLTDNFEIFQEFGADDNITPLKVLCWNDISSLTARMSYKTVEAGLEREYLSIHDNITFECNSVSVNKPYRAQFLNGDPDIYVFHILDPTIPQTHKIRSNRPAMNSSFSTSQLSSIADGKVSSPNMFETPIQTNISSLQNLSKKYSAKKSIFIFDCSFAKKSLDGILYSENSKKNPFIVFAATSHLLNYSSHLPCDLFTSCLLTPSKVALLWQSQKVGHFHSGILKEIELQTLIDQLNESEESNNILNMLNAALNAIADKIAIDLFLTTDNKKTFYDLFRRDSFTSQLFYNYMFSTRIMKALAMDPSSFPPIRDSTRHPLWDTFDLQVDRALFSLANNFAPVHVPYDLKEVYPSFVSDDLLDEAMERLHSWLRFPTSGRKMPNEICYLPMLLLSPKHFKSAIIFCSNFIQISEKTARIFLYTRSFPTLPECLNRIEANIDNYDNYTIAAFSFVVADSVLLVPKLSEYFKKKTSFWFERIFILTGKNDDQTDANNNNNNNNNSNYDDKKKKKCNINNDDDSNNALKNASFSINYSTISSSLINNDSDDDSTIANDDNAGSLIEFHSLSPDLEDHSIQLVAIASLSVLLNFLDSDEQVKLYIDSGIIESLKALESLNTLPRIKCLANLILSQLGVGFDIQIESREIESESNPLCRAAVLSRFQVTIQQLNEQLKELNEQNNDKTKNKRRDVIQNQMKEINMLRDALLNLVIKSLNDLYPLVRENALVVISHALDFSTNVKQEKKDDGKDKIKDKNDNNNDDNDNDNDNDDAEEEEDGDDDVEDDDFDLETEIKETLEDMKSCLADASFKPQNSPSSLDLVRSLRSLSYETSARVNEALIQFCVFLEAKLANQDIRPLASNLKFSCLHKLSHLQQKDQTPKSFFKHETLIPPKLQSQSTTPFSSLFQSNQASQQSQQQQQQQQQSPSPSKTKFQIPLCTKKNVQNQVAQDLKYATNKRMPAIFIGKPAISPSGLLACSNVDGSITYQVQLEEGGELKTKTVSHDWFSSLNVFDSFPHFSKLSVPHNRVNSTVNYLQFITDTKLLATSSRSQVVVIDTNMIEEPICSFCGLQQLNEDSVSFSDYNNHNFSLLQTSETAKEVKLYDFNTLKTIDTFHFENDSQKIQGIQWLKPYTTLFYVARQDIIFYDTREKEVVFKIANAGNSFIGGNASYKSPVNFVMGNNFYNGKNKQGVISMYALGGTQIASTTIAKEIKEFEVHKHLPFAASVADSFYSFNFDKGELLLQQQNLGFIPNSISLHHSESLVAGRIGNKVQCEEINY